MSEEWVTVTIVSDEADANLKKGFLEDAGIQCVIEASTFYRGAVPLFNQFKINVPKDELETAKQVLTELES